MWEAWGSTQTTTNDEGRRTENRSDETVEERLCFGEFTTHFQSAGMGFDLYRMLYFTIILHLEDCKTVAAAAGSSPFAIVFLDLCQNFSLVSTLDKYTQWTRSVIIWRAHRSEKGRLRWRKSGTGEVEMEASWRRQFPPPWSHLQISRSERGCRILEATKTVVSRILGKNCGYRHFHRGQYMQHIKNITAHLFGLPSWQVGVINRVVVLTSARVQISSQRLAEGFILCTRADFCTRPR